MSSPLGPYFGSSSTFVRGALLIVLVTGQELNTNRGHDGRSPNVPAVLARVRMMDVSFKLAPVHVPSTALGAPKQDRDRPLLGLNLLGLLRLLGFLHQRSPTGDG